MEATPSYFATFPGVPRALHPVRHPAGIAMRIEVEPHPSLRLVAFAARYPVALGGIPCPESLRALLRVGARGCAGWDERMAQGVAWYRELLEGAGVTTEALEERDGALYASGGA